MNRFHIYSIYNRKGKLFCVIQYKFNMLVSAPLEYINTNYTLLASYLQQVSKAQKVEVIET